MMMQSGWNLLRTVSSSGPLGSSDSVRGSYNTVAIVFYEMDFSGCCNISSS